MILAGVLLSSRWLNGLPVHRGLAWLKSAFGRLLQRRTLGAVTLLGALNGLLPCGLVYVACTAALASHHWWEGVAYMTLFGLGTVPMMFGLGLAGMKLQSMLRFRLQRLVPVSLVIVGGLLVLRGLALGIPYVSPADPANGPACPMCPAHDPVAGR